MKHSRLVIVGKKDNLMIDKIGCHKTENKSCTNTKHSRLAVAGRIKLDSLKAESKVLWLSNTLV